MRNYFAHNQQYSYAKTFTDNYFVGSLMNKIVTQKNEFSLKCFENFPDAFVFYPRP